MSHKSQNPRNNPVLNYTSQNRHIVRGGWGSSDLRQSQLFSLKIVGPLMKIVGVGFKAWAYNRVTQCLEVRFKWHNVHQYRPVPLQIVRKIWKARPMNAALQELVRNNRRIRFDDERNGENCSYF